MNKLFIMAYNKLLFYLVTEFAVKCRSTIGMSHPMSPKSVNTLEALNGKQNREKISF